MHRSFAPGSAIAAILLFAACTDQPSRAPLAPSAPSAAVGGQCDGSLASQIVKQQKALFTGAALADLDSRFNTIKSLCPNAFPQMIDYIKAVIAYREPPTIGQVRAQGLVDHWKSLTLYVTGTGLVRPASVLLPTGGAAVLSSGEQMLTFDERAGVVVALGSTVVVNGQPVSAGPHLFTFEPKPFACQTTTLRQTGTCYDLNVYPHDGGWNPPVTVGLCLRAAFHGPSAVGHQKAGFGTEVTQPGITYPFSCAHTETALNTWLGREAGPLGRALAHAYDYLRPRALHAEDAGVSGQFRFFSLVGGLLTVVYQDGFTANALGPLVNGTDPVVGDFPSSWLVQAESPGYIQIQNGLGDLTGNVVVLSQAQGNCGQCPVFKLLGTRVNPSPTDTIGSYEVTWQSLQNKPSVKEAPFVVLSHTGAEIARLSYVTESSQNRLRYNGAIVMSGGNPVTWTTNVHQDFKITVNLLTTNGQNSYRTSLAINNVTLVSNVPFVNAAKTMSTMGYVLTGIDAGIIAADNFLVRRLADPP
jgi:hypothetical protein